MPDKILYRLIAVAGLAIAAGAPAAASVDTSPKPSGVYKLKPGTYVRQGVACGSAPNAAIRRYDGLGLSDAHTHACRARVLSRKGARYSVTQSCVDAGVGKGPRVDGRQTVNVADALTFSQRVNGSSATYRYCPSYMLPAGLRGTPR